MWCSREWKYGWWSFPERQSLWAHQSMEFELQPEVTDCAAETACLAQVGFLRSRYYSFLRVPMYSTINPWLKTTEIYLLTVLKVKSLNSRCCQSCFLLEAPGSFFVPLLASGDHPCHLLAWGRLTPISASVSHGISFCVFLCPHFSLLIKTPVIDLGPPSFSMTSL